jgi:UDP-N-acetylmuramate--alanine ligase
MSGIAGLFLRRGVKVSGSDIKDSGIISELRRCGAEVFLGHSAPTCAERTPLFTVPRSVKTIRRCPKRAGWGSGF